ncbi:tetratricopeptide repeat protein [Streptosporangium saharense]|uniref:tetratricopeptide repeat protein n=1 Tax=Streptosporangium saharense TaxID=1706840 RepID=UPI0036A8829F
MSGNRWQERRVLIAVVVLAALGAATAVVTAFKVTDPWAVGGAAVGGAVVAAVLGFWQERYKRLTARRDEIAFKLQDGCLVLPSGRLPTVAQLDDPVRLGVHPAIVLPGAIETKPPAYVPRDIDDQVRERLAAGGFVLLVGDSTAGKSRTAYEAVRATLPDHVLIAPHDRTALAAAIEHTVRAGRAVLWLSDLEHYLGTGGLTREHIARITSGKGHRIIVATLRSTEQTRLTTQSAEGDEATRSAGREVRETLEQAQVIRLARRFTASELERAQVRTWDERIASAVRQADEFGIAEYLASGPELQRDYDNAWEVGANPRGAALVAAAIDCRRAGYTSPAPRLLLEELHTAYLEAKGGHRLRPEPVEEAWEWATRPRRATTALLSPIPDAAGDGVAVFDYLVDRRQQEEGPLAQIAEPVIRAALEHVHDPDDAAQIASTTDQQGRYHLAESGYRTALTLWRQQLGEEHPSTLTSRNNLALVLKGLGRLGEAEAEHRAELEVCRRVLGEEHPSTLISRNNLAVVLGGLGRWGEAEVEHRVVLEVRRRVLGEEHPSTLISRSNLAVVLGDLGRLEEAEAEYRAVLEACRRVLGEEHPDTLISRNGLALVLWSLGRLGEAEVEHRAVLEVRRRVLGKEHPSTLTSRNNLAVVLGDLEQWEEVEVEHRAVLEVRCRVLDEEHPDTLISRHNLAAALWGLGRLEEAEAEYRAVLEVRCRVLGEEHPDTLISRNDLALLLGDLGRLREAEVELRAVLEVRCRVLGEEHPDTLTSRDNLASVLKDLEHLKEIPDPDFHD